MAREILRIGGKIITGSISGENPICCLPGPHRDDACMFRVTIADYKVATFAEAHMNRVAIHVHSTAFVVEHGHGRSHATVVFRPDVTELRAIRAAIDVVLHDLGEKPKKKRKR